MNSDVMVLFAHDVRALSDEVDIPGSGGGDLGRKLSSETGLDTWGDEGE